MAHRERGYTSSRCWGAGSQTWPTGRGDILQPQREGTYFITLVGCWITDLAYGERGHASSQIWPTGRGDILHHKCGPRGEGTYFITDLAHRRRQNNLNNLIIQIHWFLWKPNHLNNLKNLIIQIPGFKYFSSGASHQKGIGRDKGEMIYVELCALFCHSVSLLPVSSLLSSTLPEKWHPCSLSSLTSLSLLSFCYFLTDEQQERNLQDKTVAG